MKFLNDFFVFTLFDIFIFFFPEIIRKILFAQKPEIARNPSKTRNYLTARKYLKSPESMKSLIRKCQKFPENSKLPQNVKLLKISQKTRCCLKFPKITRKLILIRNPEIVRNYLNARNYWKPYITRNYLKTWRLKVTKKLKIKWKPEITRNYYYIRNWTRAQSCLKKVLNYSTNRQ